MKFFATLLVAMAMAGCSGLGSASPDANIGPCDQVCPTETLVPNTDYTALCTQTRQQCAVKWDCSFLCDPTPDFQLVCTSEPDNTGSGNCVCTGPNGIPFDCYKTSSYPGP